MKNVFAILLLLIIIESISGSKHLKGKNIYLAKNLNKIRVKQKIINKAYRPNYINKKNIKSKFYRLEETHKKTGNTESDLQIKKFHNFERVNDEKKIKFNIFTYFIERKIVKNINLKIRIIYDNKINNPDKTATEELVQCTCTIDDNYKDKIGIKAIKKNIDYKCEGSTSLNLNIAKVTLDKDYSLLANKEQISLGGINLDSSSLNIVKASNYDKVGSLDEAQVEFPVEGNYFRINGKLNPGDLLSEGDSIPMQFITYSNNEEIKNLITCTAIKVENQECVLECDTKNKVLNATLIDFSLAESMDENIYMKINLKNQEEENKLETNAGNRRYYYYRRRGWSTGAIVGLCVGGVALIIGASILACVLRHPTTPPSLPANQTIDDKTKTVIIKADKIVYQNQ